MNFKLISSTVGDKLHCKKGFAIFPSVLSRGVSNQTLPGRDVTNQTLPGQESLVSDIPAGDGKIASFFYSVLIEFYTELNASTTFQDRLRRLVF
jgi:hypothetical protein